MGFYYGPTIVTLILGIFYCIRAVVTYSNREIISNAILDYHFVCLTNDIDYDCDYADMEPYLLTFFRVYDFGYTNILPKDKYKIIEPYVKKKE